MFTRHAPVLVILIALGFFMTNCNPTKRGGVKIRDTITTNQIDSNHLAVVDTPTSPRRDTLPPIEKVLNWCDTIQKSRFEQYVICYTKKGDSPILSDTIKILQVDPNNLLAKDTSGRRTNKKAVYNLVIMMPFMTHLFKRSVSAEVSIKSLLAIEFYEGVSLAIDSLEKMGLSLNINVFDTRKSESTLDALFLKEEVQNADVIIGPVSSRLIPKVATFAKTNGIILISPFNPRTSLVEDHPSYIQISPSYASHSKRIIDFILHQPENTKVLILGMARDTGRIDLLQEHYAIAKNDENAKLPQYVTPGKNVSFSSIRGYFSGDALNVVVIPSYKDESFVYNALRELHNLIDLIESRKNYDVIVIGMSTWKYYERMNIQYYENLNLHITSEVFIDMEEEDTKNFKEAYKTRFGIAPRHYAYVGFDIAIYTGYMLNKYGTSFHKFLEDEPAKRRHTKFSFKEQYSIESRKATKDSDLLEHEVKLVRYENEYVNLLEFEKYKFQKVE